MISCFTLPLLHKAANICKLVCIPAADTTPIPHGKQKKTTSYVERIVLKAHTVNHVASVPMYISYRA